jgi:beta-fructofuranosidase
VTSTRPRLHFTPRTGWINDPHGLTYHDGRYHLFFQHVPEGTAWAPGCHWGHATSRDLLRWAEQPVALSPGDGDDGCWSGSLVAQPGREAVIFYTSVQLPDLALGRVRRARPRDAGWRDWVKEDVVVQAPEDSALTAFRDPFVFRDLDRWSMLVGAGRADGSASVLGYTSADLVTWRYAGDVAGRPGSGTQPIRTGTMWECPQLVPVANKHVLVVSVLDQDVLHYVACAVGSYRDGRFDAEQWSRLTYGPAPYAASAYHDLHGRPGLLAWLRGVAGPSDGWAGALSVPTLLELSDHGRPSLSPHPNAGTRRRDLSPAQWSAGTAVDVEWSPRRDAASTLLLCDRQDEILAEFRAADDSLTLSVGDEGASTMPWPGGEVRLLVDGPIVEIFCGGALMASAVSPRHRQLRSAGGSATFRCSSLE